MSGFSLKHIVIQLKHLLYNMLVFFVFQGAMIHDICPFCGPQILICILKLGIYWVGRERGERENAMEILRN